MKKYDDFKLDRLSSSVRVDEHEFHAVAMFLGDANARIAQEFVAAIKDGKKIEAFKALRALCSPSYIELKEVMDMVESILGQKPVSNGPESYRVAYRKDEGWNMVDCAYSTKEAARQSAEAVIMWDHPETVRVVKDVMTTELILVDC